MLYAKELYNFAVKWRNKFKNENIDYEELINIGDEVSHKFSERWYLGEKFTNVYGEAFDDFYELANICDKVTDVKILLSAIRLKCKEFMISDKEDEKKKILEFNNRSWFILVCARLAIIAKEKVLVLEKTPRKIKIISNEIYYYKTISNYIVEEEITINSDGSIKYLGYTYKDGFTKSKIAPEKSFRIPEAFAKNISDKIMSYFRGYGTEIIFEYSGKWELEITDATGEIHKFKNHINENSNNELDFFDLIRDYLGINNLYVFSDKKRGKFNKFEPS